MFEHSVSHCPIDVTWYPFDDQQCQLSFESWKYNSQTLNITAKQLQELDYHYNENEEWNLLGLFLQRKRRVALTRSVWESSISFFVDILFRNYDYSEEVISFLSRVRTLTRDIEIAILSHRPSVRPSVCLSVRDTLVLYENGLKYRHRFFTIRCPIILVLQASNIFTKFRRGHPLLGR